MIVITKNAENSFIQEINKCLDKNIAQRCLYLRFSQLDIPQEEWFPYLIEPIDTAANHEIPQAFLCQDHDIFILMPHWTKKSAYQILAYLQTKLGETPEINTMAEIFEIKIDAKKLITMAKRKIDSIQRQHEKFKIQNAKRKNLEKIKDTLDAIDPGKISSLSARRMKKSVPQIMVAEDDALTRMLVKNVIESKYDIHISETGLDTITDYVDYTPDLLFLDIGLPDISGLNVLETLMQIDPEAYIIMFSGKKDENTILNTLKTGAFGFVAKPFTREKLYQYIQQSPTIQYKNNRTAS